MRYEWDNHKNDRNQQKHRGISFELATLIFEDPRFLLALDRYDEAGEQRWHAIGMVEAGESGVLLAVHVYREDDDGEEIIRIISARRADPHEFRRYQKQAMD